MALLEREGYLTQPHTSAGRIPTEKGYRFFVDHLKVPGTLDAWRRQRVTEFFRSAHGELEQMLHDTSRMLSGLTNYAAMVLAPGHDRAAVRSAQIVGLGPQVALAVVVLADGAVEKRTLELAAEADDAELSAASERLAESLVGRPFGSVYDELPAERPGSRLANAALRALAPGAGDDPDQVYVGGVSRMAAAFDAVETVRQVLVTLEQQYVVVSLLRDLVEREPGPSVAIGTELGLEPLTHCAVVVSPYDVEGRRAGSIGVLGPTRMKYDQALAAVALVSQRLGRRLSEG